MADETASEPETNADLKNARPAAPGAPRRKKTTGFPVVSLAEVATILKEAGKYGFDHSTSAFAAYMGHSTTNSGAFRQRLAAFRDWKLIAGRGDSLSMTEIARVIAHPTSPDAERRALQSAFMNSPVFFKLYEGSAKGQPLDGDRLGSRGVLDFGVAPGSKSRFVESFLDSAVAAGLAEVTEDDQVVLLPFGSDKPVDDGPDRPEPDSSAPTVSGHRRNASRRESTPVVHQSWSIAGGSIEFEIRCDNPLPAIAFATVGEVVASLERLASALAPVSEVDVHETENPAE